jgi:methylenetetrahydrofolate reductase (NADPH)
MFVASARQHRKFTELAEEGKKLCIELIQQVREIAGVKGVHVMACRREHLVYEIIRESGILQERLEVKAREGP